MDLVQWQRAKALLASVASLASADRMRFLEVNCADPVLRDEIASLLAYDTETSLLGSSVEAPDLAQGDDEFSAGSRVGPYIILDRLGRGGMGEVFLGNDSRLHRKVALKRLLAPGSTAEDTRLRILHEARAAARINHPNVATVHDVIEHESHVFIVMEYVDGESLSARLRRGRLPIPSVIKLGRQLSSGLAAAHAQGIVHGDLKPGNIQVTRDDVVKVLDFGLASVVSLMSRTTGPSHGAVLKFRGGTPGYMSPEQMLGHEVGVQSDIFSVGIVLHEMVTGERLYPDAAAAEILGAMLTRRGIARQQADVPPKLSELITTALEVQLNRRCKSAADIELALSSIESSPVNTQQTADEVEPEAGDLADIRARLLLAGSELELRRLQYEVERYLSRRPHDIDARLVEYQVVAALGSLAGRPLSPAKAALRGDSHAHRSWGGRSQWIAWQRAAGVVGLVAVMSTAVFLWRAVDQETRPVGSAHMAGYTTSIPASAPATSQSEPALEARRSREFVPPRSATEAASRVVTDAAAAQRQPASEQATVAPRQPEAALPAAEQRHREADQAVATAAQRERQEAAQRQREVEQATVAVQRQREEAAQRQREEVPQHRLDEAAIREVVRLYAAAYTELNAKAVKKVYPNIDEDMVTRLFGQIRLQRVAATVTEVAFHNSTSATLTAIWSVHYEPKLGRSFDRSAPIRLTLKKEGNSWLISDRQE